MTPEIAQRIAQDIAMNGLPASTRGSVVLVTAYDMLLPTRPLPIRFSIYEKNGEIFIQSRSETHKLTTKTDPSSIVNAVVDKLSWSSPTPF